MYTIISCSYCILILMKILAVIQCQRYSINNSPRDYINQNDKDNLNSNNQIPMDVIQRINSMSDLTEFYDEFFPGESMHSLENFGERSVGTRPKPAVCSPEFRTVPLEPLDEPEFMNNPLIKYIPSCTRLYQCGGCCTVRELSCQPIETEPKNFVLTRMQYNTTTGSFENRGNVIASVDEHKRCTCQCVMKEEHCNKLQTYDKRGCKCDCNNVEDRSKCLRDSNKVWDSNKCVCQCRDDLQCTSGTFFDLNTCRCLEINVSTTLNHNIDNAQILDRKRFILKPIAVPRN